MSMKKLDAQFVLAIIIIAIWAYFLYKPLNLIDSIHFEDPALKDKLSAILDTAYKISALFSTALGFVLGHFFGKQGIETAQEQATQAKQEQVKAIKEKEVAVEAAGAGINKYGELEEQIMEIRDDMSNKVAALIDQLKKSGN